MSGAITLPAGDWFVDALPPFALDGDGLVHVGSLFSSVVWVAEECDISLEIRSTLGAPLAGASVTWTMDEGIANASSDIYIDLDHNHVISDALGRAILEKVPIPWTTRVLVSHPSHLPFQGTIQPECTGQAQVVTLQHERWDSSSVLLLLDTIDRPLEGVDTYAEIVDEAWIDAYPIFLGRTDSSGTLPLPKWVRGANALVFRGSAYPSRYRWRSGTFPHAGLTMRVPTPVFGRFNIANHSEDENLEIRLIDDDPGQLTVLPKMLTLPLESDLFLSLSVPNGRRMSASIANAGGTHSWNGIVYAEVDGWEQDVELSRESELLELITSGEQIAEYSIDEELDTWLPVGPLARDGAVALLLPPRTGRVKVRSSSGTTGLLSRHCDAPQATVHVAFAPHYPVRLVLRDAVGNPVNDVQVQLSGIGGSAAPQYLEEGCWAWWPHYRFVASPDPLGVLNLNVPEGEYSLKINNLPWRETVAFSTLNQTAPELTSIQVTERGLDQMLVVPRPRALWLELQPTGGTAPQRWILWDLTRNSGQVFFGSIAHLWITDAAGSYAVRCADGEPLASFEVPAGQEPWKQEVQF